ncbi:MAG: hypothetical protein IID44_27790 [Planctomycetes bacterium]|nr:hypothetical protein [Planctomycetota bacterium]
MKTEQPQRDRRARGLTSLGHQPLAVDARSFAQFDLWISLDLEKLVDRWAHAAAPNASMPARMAKHHEV